jgi:hypothetical protein
VRITFSETTPGTVHRALRDDVTHPVVTIADGPGHDVVHEDGTPEGRGGVLLIEPFDERLVPAWYERREHFRSQRGYMGSRLLRGEPGYVAVTRWSSPLMYFRATQALETATPFTSALYLSD